jgi:hypothetical protein
MSDSIFFFLETKSVWGVSQKKKKSYSIVSETGTETEIIEDNSQSRRSCKHTYSRKKGYGRCNSIKIITNRAL